MRLIERNDYLDKLIALRGVDVIKVVTGIRRSGKSTIFRMYINYLLQQGVDEKDIVLHNFEDFACQPYMDNPQKLHDEIIELAKTGRNIYVFLDEVQNMKSFEKIIDSLNLRSNIDLYVTGSNSFLLSGELATLLTGRYVEIHILPFSFKEFVEMQENPSRLDLLFSEYLQNGGMPGGIGLSELVKIDYLRDIYNSIMQKDIMSRNSWRKTDHFDRLVHFIFNAVGTLISPHNLSIVFKNIGFCISSHTVEKYLDAVCKAYLFYKVSRYNLKGDVILSTQEKYYASDMGLKNAALGHFETSDMGHCLENIVYLQLIRRGNQVYIGKTDNAEIDFIAHNPQGVTEYIQVAWTAKGQHLFEREISPFEQIKDFNRRTLITTDVEPISYHKGIQKINIIDWLMQ